MFDVVEPDNKTKDISDRQRRDWRDHRVRPSCGKYSFFVVLSGTDLLIGIAEIYCTGLQVSPDIGAGLDGEIPRSHYYYLSF